MTVCDYSLQGAAESASVGEGFRHPLIVGDDDNNGCVL